MRGLEYLQKEGIGYGVLHCGNIFIDEGIRLLDPSATAEDPLVLAPNRLYSPEILAQYEDVDILKSDVFVLGLCLIEASLLLTLSGPAPPRYDPTRLGLYVQRVRKIYGEELADVISAMLQYHP